MYKIPNRKKNLITSPLKEDFIKYYIQEIKRIFGTKSNFEIICSLRHRVGTAPFFNAFRDACVLNFLDGGIKLFKYHQSLDCFDSDSFGYEFSDMIFIYYIENYEKYDRQDILYGYSFYHPQEDDMLKEILSNKKFNITKDEYFKLVFKLCGKISNLESDLISLEDKNIELEKQILQNGGV